MTHVHVEVVRNTRNVMAKTLKYSLIVLLSLIQHFAFSQNVEINVDERLNQELRMKNAKVDTTKMEGFRIQIFFGSDMRTAQAAMSSFKAKYPDYASQVYQLYQQPTWKVRVGNYYREIDAQELLQALREHFPGAFVVRDEIELPPLSMP